jgi:2-polyprenyl-3-methyl-5-hydroxy-6-metoxy-1,4-benzoquinol methylase
MSGDKNHCGFCKAENSNVLYPTYDIFGNTYTINKCNECKAVFLAPRPDAELLNKAYNTDYYGNTETKFKNSLVENTIDHFRSGRARKALKLAGHKSKVLDIGCGNGNFLKYLFKYGNCEVYGTEFDGNSAKRASLIKEINLKIGEIQSEDHPDNFFDLITMFHVFEHLADPKQVLQIIREKLKPNGHLIISIPNIDSWQSRIFKGKWLHLDPPRHLFFFKPSDLIEILKGERFDIQKIKYFSIEQNPFGMIQSILNKMQKKRDMLFEILKGNKVYASGYSKFNLFTQKAFFLLSFPFFIISDIFAAIFHKGATVELTFKKSK